ncbi:MAG: methyltransferase [Mycobacteriaceae bacterium]|nr:methyltransferase [Mycobacteriaceae bacterium]
MYSAELEAARRVAAALREVGYTPEGCAAALGPVAWAALARAEVAAALRATRDGPPLAAVIRLFLLRAEVPRDELDRVLPIADAQRLGLVERADGVLRALADIRPYGAGLFVVSDVGTAIGGATSHAGRAAGISRRDVVLGAGGASETLAGITVRRQVGAALDLGAGCGVQALRAAAHADRVVATDLNPRAVRFTALSAALSGVDNVATRTGSLFEPVAGLRFDLIVSNPPFVISPGERFTYRDGGLSGDELCRRVVAGAAEHLAEGGHAHILANWLHLRGEDWAERVAGWLAPTGCDAWAVQRDVQDPAQYAELWLRDGGDHRRADYPERYDSWLAAFEDAGVAAVGFGWISLHKSGATEPVVRIEDWPHAVEQPLGPAIESWFGRADYLRRTGDDALLRTHFALAGDVTQEQHIVLRQAGGLRRAVSADTISAALAGACDGALSAEAIGAALAEVLELDPAAVRADVVAALRAFVADGLLHPVDS